MSLRSSITWRNTYWTESPSIRVPAGRGAASSASTSTCATSFTGPILTRVWNTPDNGYAERFKHVFEPEFIVQRTTEFEDYDRIVKIEGGDYTYGGNHAPHLRADQPAAGAPPRRRDGSPTARVREFLNVQIQQSYYSNPHASPVDGNYSGGFFGRPPSNFSPVALIVRANPTNTVGATLAARVQRPDRRVRDDPDQRQLERATTGWRRRADGASGSYVYGINPLLRPAKQLSQLAHERQPDAGPGRRRLPLRHESDRSLDRSSSSGSGSSTTPSAAASASSTRSSTIRT